MLKVRLETICYIIAKAREFQAKEQVVFPDDQSGPADDWALQVLADHADDMSLQEIRVAVEDLAPEQLIRQVPEINREVRKDLKRELDRGLIPPSFRPELERALVGRD